jgi:hypothetical protein
MPNRARIIVSVLFLIFLLVGVVLFLKSDVKTTTVLANKETQVCLNSYSINLSPFQAKTIECQVQANSWIDISAATSHNSSLEVNVVLAPNGTDGTNQTIYSNTGESISALFPLFSNGSAFVQILNLHNSTSALNARVSVFKEIPSNLQYSTPGYPYRREGVAIMIIGGAFLFLFGWDPKGFGTKILSKKENSFSRTPLSQLFRNIWFLRAISLVSGIVISSLLLAYSIFFLYTFEVSGSVLSFFPWSWKVLYTSPAPTNDLFIAGFLAANTLLFVFTLTLWAFVLPRLERSLREEDIAFSGNFNRQQENSQTTDEVTSDNDSSSEEKF